MVRRTRVHHAHPQSRGRARRYLLTVALGAALLVPATALAAGGPNHWEATSYAEYGNGNCGETVHAPLLARVDFVRAGGHMSIRVRMDGVPADTNTDYVLSLWDAATCDQIGGDIGTVTTDGFGVADETFSGIRTKGAKSFFATLWNTDLEFYNDTLIVP